MYISTAAAFLHSCYTYDEKMVDKIKIIGIRKLGLGGVVGIWSLIGRKERCYIGAEKVTKTVEAPMFIIGRVNF
jgi:hypothetical protein